MLRNEKYKGDALLQKTYTIDFLTKKKSINKGELPQYYVENNHEAIVDKEIFNMVQVALDRKDKNKGSATLFSSKLICGECGHFFGSKVWHSTSKYRRVIYRCNHKYKGELKCQTPHVTEEEVKAWFIQAINQLLTNKDEVVNNLKLLLAIKEQSDLSSHIGEVETEARVVSQMVENLVRENATSIQDQDDYQKQYHHLSERYDSLIHQLEQLEQEQLTIAHQKSDIEQFIHTLEKQDELVTEFDVLLWETTIDKVEIETEKIVTFTFKNGVVVSV